MKPAAPLTLTRTLALPLALALAACSGESDEPAPAAQETASPAPVASASEDASAAPATPQAAKAIPSAFLGAWDTEASNCATVSETRMVIAADSVKFYESHGEVTNVEIDSPERIVVSIAMEGEGQQWQMARMFSLSEGGARMTPASVDAEEQLPPTLLKKCPA